MLTKINCCISVFPSQFLIFIWSGKGIQFISLLNISLPLRFNVGTFPIPLILLVLLLLPYQKTLQKFFHQSVLDIFWVNLILRGCRKILEKLLLIFLIRVFQKYFVAVNLYIIFVSCWEFCFSNYSREYFFVQSKYVCGFCQTFANSNFMMYTFRLSVEGKSSKWQR